MMTKKMILTLLTAIVTMALNAANNPAETQLAKTASALRSAKSLTAQFAATTPDGSGFGTLVMAGDKFKMSTDDMTIWYDGRNQWTMMKSAGECNLTEPTAEELQEVNPLAVIDRFRSNYKASLLQSAAKVWKIRLTSRSPKAEIRTADLTIDPRTNLPKSIVMTTRSGQKISISVSSVKTGSALPLSTFKFDNKKFPTIELIDLR